MLILFYKTRLSRLNLIIFSSPLDTSRASLSLVANSLLFLFSSLSSSLDSNSLIKSLDNSINNVDKFIKFSFSKEFVNKKKKKKKDKKKKKKEENKIKKNVEKKNNNNKRFSYD